MSGGEELGRGLLESSWGCGDQKNMRGLGESQIDREPRAQLR